MSNVYRIAGKNIRINSLFSFVQDFCGEYQTDSEPDFFVTITNEDIKNEAVNLEIPEDVVEVSAVFRKIAEIMPTFETFMIHGSAISVDNEGYLFTAKSGTGKSTHSRLWRELFGNRAVIVNDDKPFVKVFENEVRVFGSPYSGKEGLNTNISVPLKAICVLERAETNRIRNVDFFEVLPILVQQTYHPSDKKFFNRTLELLEGLKKFVKFYRLSCNKKLEAAEISYNAMKG